MKNWGIRIISSIFSYEWMAFIISFVGIIFMVAVLVNGISRFGLTWSFDPKFNSEIGAFVASIAGTLFALTNALLLYATLKSQNRSQENSELQYTQITRDRNYNRLYSKLQALESAILEHSVRDDSQGSQLSHVLPALSGYNAWRQTFEHWRNVCFPSSIVSHFKLGGHVDPDSFLENQAFVNDTFLLIGSVRQDLKLDLDQQAREYLTGRLDAMVRRLASSRADLEYAQRSLSQVVAKGIMGRPKQEYVSNLLHVIDQIDLVLKLLPASPYKVLSPFEPQSFTFDADTGSLILECDAPISFQINTVHFETKDGRWVLRFHRMAFLVRIEAFSQDGISLNTIEHRFSFGALLFNATDKSSTFETNGEWWLEGSVNQNVPPYVEHSRWVLTATLEYTPVGKARTTNGLEHGEQITLAVKSNGRLPATFKREQ